MPTPPLPATDSAGTTAAAAITTVQAAATPVAVSIGDVAIAHAVSRHVESVLGWQVVADTPGLPARLHIVDLDHVAPGAVVVLDTADLDAVRQAMAAGAADVLIWPADATRLAILSPRHAVRIPGVLIPVGGSAAGVGTTTACVAIAAALAWRGRTTWLVTGADGWQMIGLDDVGDAVKTCTAVPSLTVVATLRDLNGRTCADDVIVVDVGTDTRRQVLVARPDRHLLTALHPVTAGKLGTRRPERLLTVGRGGLRPREVVRLAGRLPHLHLDHDSRVARAGLRGWLPGRLPGRMVQDLANWFDPTPGRGRTRSAQGVRE